MSVIARPVSAAVLVLALGAAAALPAQETPTTPPAEDQGMLLAFKHKIGQLQRYRSTVKVDAAISPEGGPANIGPVPLMANSVMTFTEKVAGTRQGTATLSLAVNSLVSSSDILGMKSVTRVQNGKLTTSVNGRPAGSQAEAAAELAQLRKPSQVRRDATGMTVPVGDPRNAFGQVFGSSTYTIVQFPTEPVKVGDSWETSQKIRPTVISGRAPFVVPEIEFRYSHTLKRLETRNGRKQALIETSGSGSAIGEGANSTLTQSITGTTRFDVARGSVVSSAYNIILGLEVQLPGGAGQGAEGVNAVRVDGTIDVVVTEAPAPAPAKKKARR